MENIRTPAKILDLRSLLTNSKEENVIFDLAGNNFGIFEIDQLAGELTNLVFSNVLPSRLIDPILGSIFFLVLINRDSIVEYERSREA